MDELTECPKCHASATVKYWPSKRGGVWSTRCQCGYSYDSAVMPDGYKSSKTKVDHKEEDRQRDLGW